MIKEKLRQAGIQSAAGRRKRALWLLVGGLLVAMAIVALPRLFQPSPVTETIQLVSPHQKSPPVDQAKLREAFVTQLQAYQNTFEATLADANLKQWNNEQDAALTALRLAAMTAFGNGDNAAALDKLSALPIKARQTLASRDAMLASELTATKQALADDDAAAATIHVTKAMQMKPAGVQTQALAQQAEKLPALLLLLRQADVARTENNPEKELIWLNKAVVLAPDRHALAQRRDQLGSMLKQHQFSQLISHALSAVEKKNISAARRDYDKAVNLYPSRSELQHVHAAIVGLSDRLALQQAIAATDKAMAQDDWPGAQSLYAQAATRFPKNRDLRDGLQLADKVVSLQTAINDYLRKPERLSSGNVHAAAEDTLIQARVFAVNSRSLAAQANSLKDVLAEMNIKLPVLVTSDNKTYIVVRGVGRVGLTLARTIELKPGVYTFEGSRSGYKSTLVQLRLPVGNKSLEVEVVCNERI